MTQPAPSALSNSATSRVAASTSPTLTACTHTTCRLATTARNPAGIRPSRPQSPARYRPRSFAEKNIRSNQYGAPPTKTPSSARLYKAIAKPNPAILIASQLLRSTTGLYPCTSEDDNQPCMNPHRNPRNNQVPAAPSITALSSWMGCKPRARWVLFAGILLASAPIHTHAADKKTAPPAKPADSYPASDAHPNEHVTIAADPCDDPKLCSFFRLPYIQHGLLPIRVIVTNDGDQALQLDEARMQFISANNDKIPAATEDDINRRIFTMHSAQGTKIPLTPITIHHPPVDKKISQDDDDFGFKGTVVNPHSTLAGYLFYDIQDLDDPALRHAELYIKMIRTLDGAHELFAFSIPLDKWLAANPEAPSNHPRK